MVSERWQLALMGISSRVFGFTTWRFRGLTRNPTVDSCRGGGHTFVQRVQSHDEQSRDWIGGPGLAIPIGLLRPRSPGLRLEHSASCVSFHATALTALRPNRKISRKADYAGLRPLAPSAYDAKGLKGKTRNRNSRKGSQRTQKLPRKGLTADRQKCTQIWLWAPFTPVAQRNDQVAHDVFRPLLVCGSYFCALYVLLRLFRLPRWFADSASSRPFAEIPSSFRDQSGGADKAGDADC
jgi:hypothetical protein